MKFLPVNVNMHFFPNMHVQKKMHVGMKCQHAAPSLYRLARLAPLVLD